MSFLAAGLSAIDSFSEKHEEILTKAKEHQNAKVSMTPGDIVIIRTLISQFSPNQTAAQKQESIKSIERIFGTIEASDVQKEGDAYSLSMKTINTSVRSAIQQTTTASAGISLLVGLLALFSSFQGVGKQE